MIKCGSIDPSKYNCKIVHCIYISETHNCVGSIAAFCFVFLYCYNVSPIQTTRQLNVNLHYLDLQMVAVSRDIFPFFPLIDLKVSSGDQSEGLMFEMNSAKGKKSSLKVATPGDENVATLEMH